MRIVPSFSLPSSVWKQSQLLLQPTEVELGLQFGVEFDNSHSVQLNVELDLQVRDVFDNIPYNLYSSLSIELKLLVNQFETPCLSVLVYNDCCTPWYCILIPYPTLAHHSCYLASNRKNSLSAQGALARWGKVDVVLSKSGRGFIQKSNSYSNQLSLLKLDPVQSQVGVEFDTRNWFWH